MDTDIDMSWPEVTADELRAVLATIDYYRDAWSNAILYLEKRTKRRIAFELTAKGFPADHAGDRHFLHPGLR